MDFKGLAISASATVTRGPLTWAYFYTWLGFALGIEAAIISMTTPLKFPLNVIVFVTAGAASVYFVLFNGWFQNKLVGWKNWYENKAR